MKSFLGYYKWHIFFVAIFVVCISIFMVSSCNKSVPDLVINVVSPGRINVQTFNDKKAPLVRLLTHDVDEDGEKNLQLVSYPCNSQSDMNMVFEELAVPSSSDIIITTEKTFLNFKNKEIFVDMKEFISEIDSDKYTVLKDSSDRIYAVSLEGNDYLKNMGFYDTSDLYIAVIADDGDDISKEKKNARNIALAIIKEHNF